MPIAIENRGRRAAVIQLDATVLKRRQTVLTSKLNPNTGVRTVVQRSKVLGESLTVLCGERLEKLPNGRPIPDSVAQLAQVKGNTSLKVTVLTEAEWSAKHRKSSGAAGPRRARVKTETTKVEG